MSKEIKMPQLSDTMDSGKILKWNKNVGDTVKRGEILAEVETDKANLEIESFDNGVLLAIKVPVNQVAQVMEVIAIIGDAGESVNSESSSVADKTEVKVIPTPVQDSPIEVSSPAVNSAQVVKRDIADSQQNSQRIVASPLAKQIAAQSNIDLRQVHGSGPHGRITKKDVLTSNAPLGMKPPTPTLAPTPEIVAQPSVTSVTGAPPQVGTQASSTPLSKMRQTIANRMQQAVTEIPHFYTTASINMKQAKSLRSVCKENPDFKSISINHLVMKAAAYALQKVPRANCAYKESQLYNPGAINIGIVTAIEDGLLIPVIKDVDRLSLKDLAFETKSAIERARAGRPSGSDLSGGTFTISNMGMYEVENFTAIISPGQGAILAVSAIIDTPIAEAGVVVIAPIMKVTLSVDHRIIDGSIASAFLQEFKTALEQPAIMLL